MILIKAYKDKQEVLGNGTMEAVLREIELLTEENERNRIFMVDEVRPSERTIIRSFASESEGYLFDLLICDGVASQIECADY